MKFWARLLVAAGVLAAPVFAQSTTLKPDCVIDFRLTAAGQTSGGLGTCGNNQQGILQWTLTYKSTGFTAPFSLRVESAPDAGGDMPGAWVAFVGTVVTGINPNTAITQADSQFFGFNPFVRVALNSAAGSGLVTGELYGCRQPGCGGGLALGTPPTGPCGGDLSGTFPNCNVVNGSHIVNSSIPNSGLVNPSMTVNGTVCTLGASCTPSAAPSGACGGDLGGTFPNCTVTNGSHIINASIPNSGLVNPSTTVNGTVCTLGASCTPSAAPSGSCGGDLGGTFPNCTVTNGSHITNASIPNSGLVNPSTTVNGTTCTLGSSCTPGATLANQFVNCAGTAYTLTASLATVTLGTTSPTITIGAAGTYLLLWSARVDHSGATYAANRTITVTLSRTNNTPGALVGGGGGIITNIITTTTETAEGGNVSGFLPYTTANTNDIIVIQASVSVLPTAGSSVVSACKLGSLKIS